MNIKDKYLIELINLIYDKHHNLIPFLDVFRKEIRKICFLDLDNSITAQLTLKDRRFEIIINTNFIKVYELNDEDILWIICHEIGHYILNHLTTEYVYSHSKEFCNIAFDCQVNSMLFNINERNPIEILSKFYHINYQQYLSGEDRNGYYFLLVPPFMNKNEFRKDFEIANIDKFKADLIIEFWFKNYSKEALSINEIVDYLEQLIDEVQHSGNNNNIDYNEDELPKTLQELGGTIIQNNSELENQKIEISSINQLFDLSDIVKNKRTTQTLHSAIIKSMFRDKSSKLHGISETVYRSIIPNVKRKESLFYSYELLPTFYDNSFFETTSSHAAIYIDFSISTSPYHKNICKNITALRSDFQGPYFGFSDQVQDLSYQDLLTGRFDISGTEIETVIEHINKNRFKKALIITDGEFSKSHIKTKAELFVLLFEKNNSVESLRSSGAIKGIWFLNK